MRTGTVIVIAALALAACNSGPEHDHAAVETAEHNEEHTPGEIVFDENRQKLFGVVCGKVEYGPFVETLKAGGRLVTASDDEITLVAPASGIVRFRQGGLAAGMPVSRGTVVAEISSEGVAGGDRIAKARAAYEAARAEYLRDSVLVIDNIVTALHFEESRLAYTNARLELEALSGGNINGPVEVRSGLSGKIERVFVSNGKFVEAGQPVAVIGGGRLLELQVDVPSRYADIAASAADARFQTSKGTMVTVGGIGGRLLGRSQNATDGYLTVSFLVPQTEELVGGVFTEAWVMTRASESVISVPIQAVIEEQGVTSVFVRLDEDCFEKREVVLGNSDGSRYQVLGGLSEGEEVVFEGAMHIRLASFQTIPHGHSHNH